MQLITFGETLGEKPTSVLFKEGWEDGWLFSLMKDAVSCTNEHFPTCSAMTLNRMQSCQMEPLLAPAKGSFLKRAVQE